MHVFLNFKKKRPKEKREKKNSNLYDPLYWLGSMVLRNQNTNPKKKKKKPLNGICGGAISSIG
jgi:hypothetical protein